MEEVQHDVHLSLVCGQGVFYSVHLWTVKCRGLNKMIKPSPKCQLAFYFIKQIKDNSVTENEKLWLTGLLPDTRTYPLYMYQGDKTKHLSLGSNPKWVPGLELDTVTPQFLPHPPTARHPGRGWDQRRKENGCLHNSRSWHLQLFPS